MFFSMQQNSFDLSQKNHIQTRSPYQKQTSRIFTSKTATHTVIYHETARKLLSGRSSGEIPKKREIDRAPRYSILLHQGKFDFAD